MALPTDFDARRLQKLAWTIPFKLAFAPVVVCGLAALVLSGGQYYGPTAGERFMQIWPWCVGIGLFFSVCGLMYGKGFAASATEMLSNDFGMTVLPETAPLTQRVHRMASELNLPKPRVAVMRTANAYAIGTSRNDAAVVIGLPLMEQLELEELDAIIGHELGHIVSGDMARMQMAAGFQTMIDNMISAGTRSGARQARKPLNAQLILLFGKLVQSTLFFLGKVLMMLQSRRREFVADAFGAAVTSPKAMAGALKKLNRIAADPSAKGHKYACLMFFGTGGSLLSTHPTLDERLHALEEGASVSRLITAGTGAKKAFQMTNVESFAKSASERMDQTQARVQAVGKRLNPLQLKKHAPSIEQITAVSEQHLYLLATGTCLMTFFIGLQL